MACVASAPPCSPKGVVIEVDLGPRRPAPPMLLARLQGPRRSVDLKASLPGTPPRSPASREAAEKAKARNEEKLAVASRTCEERERQLAARRADLEQSMTRASERRSEVLAGISSKAHAHAQAVVETATKHQQSLSGRADLIKQQLWQRRSAPIRCGQASAHNKLVAEKLQKHRERKRQQLEELRAKIVAGPRPSAASLRAARSARHNSKVRSKVEGQQLLLKQREEALKAKVVGGPRPSSATSRAVRSACYNGRVSGKVEHQRLAMKKREEALRAKLQDKACRVARRIVKRSGQPPVAAAAA